VTWDSTCFPFDITAGGGVGNRDYYGVDATWYTGGSWSRPVWDMEYIAVTTHRVILNAAHIKLDNVEIKRLNASSLASAPGLLGCLGAGCLVTNSYIHGWRTTSVSDGAYGGIILPTASPQLDFTIDNTEVENSENIGIQRSGVCIRSVAIIQNGSRIHDNSSGILYCIDFNGSYLYNITGNTFDGIYHENGIYLDPITIGATQGYIRNSYLHDVAGGANMAYPNVRGGATVTMYNNVLYGTMSAQLAVEIDPYQYAAEGAGTFIAYNNTIYNYDVAATAFHVVDRGVSQKVLVLALYNNHVINAASLTDQSASTVTTYNNGTNLSQSAATASGQGYTLGSLYAPTSVSGSTYNAGTDESGTFTTDILGITRPLAVTWDIGAYEFNIGSVIPAASPPFLRRGAGVGF
jgi:hypothetical protein